MTRNKNVTLLRVLLAAVLALTAMPKAHGESLIVEAESFSRRGGWVVDQQFMDLMGSPYLIAHGMGVPVSDAVTTVDIGSGGTYHVYVRTYNWTSPWTTKPGAGAFQLSVGGKRLHTVGQTGNRWQWQKAGTVRLKAGKTQLRLHDLTGFDGRCDAILLTIDGSLVPPDDARSQDAFRSGINGTSLKPRDAGEYDMVVVGAGVAGMSAAVAAARLGLRVALIGDRPVAGGNNSSEVRVHMGGRLGVGPYPKLGQLQQEFAPCREGNAQPAAYYEDQKKMQWLQQEHGVSLFMGVHADGVTMDGARIASITARNVLSGERLRFRAPLYADCTGDATIGYLAGADWRMGRESRSEYGESRAPERADSLTMGASVQWYAAESKSRERFPLFEYGVVLNDSTAERVLKGEWTWETGMNRNQITEAERIRDYGLMVVYSNWSYLKNRLPERRDYANYRLDWVAYVAGKRESRRLLGDYVLKESDLVRHMPHEDASFAATWSIDLHEPDPANTISFPGNEYKATTRHTVIYPTAVPYRCLYSRNVDNLFMAGRNISTTHVALGSTRVMRTTGAMGEVVGMAASLCKEYGVTPRQVYFYHLDKLKRLMQKGVAKEGVEPTQDYNEGGWLDNPPIIK